MAIRALSLGKPLVVSDVGWFSELPDSVAAKVPVDELRGGDAGRDARAARGGRRPARANGRRSAEYVRQEHDLDRVADLYVAALEEVAGGTAVRDAVLDEVRGRPARSA